MAGLRAGEVWNKGRMYRRAYLKPGEGLVQEPTLGSGAVLKISDAHDMEDWLSTLATDVENHLAPGFSGIRRWRRHRTSIEFHPGV